MNWFTVIIPGLYALAIVINFILWFNELRALKLITLGLDLSSTIFLVTLTGGSAIIAMASLWASLILSAYLNSVKIPEPIRAIAKKMKRPQ